MDALDEREKRIEESLDQAEKIKNDAQLTLSEVKKRQNEVKGEIELIEKENYKLHQIHLEKRSLSRQSFFDELDIDTVGGDELSRIYCAVGDRIEQTYAQFQVFYGVREG